jgi:hypothetical protein
MQIRGAAAALVVLLFLYATPALAQAPAERPWRVLILNDADPTLPAFIALDSAIRGALAAPGRHPVNVFAESLDMLRSPESLFEDELVALVMLAQASARTPPAH